MRDFYNEDDDADYTGDEETDISNIEKEEELPDWELEDPTED